MGDFGLLCALHNAGWVIIHNKKCLICGNKTEIAFKIGDYKYPTHAENCFQEFEKNIAFDLVTEFDFALQKVRRRARLGKELRVRLVADITTNPDLKRKIINTILAEDNTLIIAFLIKKFRLSADDLFTPARCKFICETGKIHIVKYFASVHGAEFNNIKYLSAALKSCNTPVVKFLLETFLFCKKDLDSLNLGVLKYHSQYYSKIKRTAIEIIKKIELPSFDSSVSTPCFMCGKIEEFPKVLSLYAEIKICTSLVCRSEPMIDINKWLEQSIAVYWVISCFEIANDVRKLIIDIFIQF